MLKSNQDIIVTPTPNSASLFDFLFKVIAPAASVGTLSIGLTGKAVDTIGRGYDKAKAWYDKP